MAANVAAMRWCRWAAVVGIGLACAASADTAFAQRRGRRGPSPQQIKAMQEQMQYQQQEMIRVQTETAAKEKELVAKFDENGDGKLVGKERSMYDAHLRDIRFGRAPNPFADIKPLGQGPRPGKK